MPRQYDPDDPLGAARGCFFAFLISFTIAVALLSFVYVKWC